MNQHSRTPPPGWEVREGYDHLILTGHGYMVYHRHPAGLPIAAWWDAYPSAFAVARRLTEERRAQERDTRPAGIVARAAAAIVGLFGRRSS